MEEGKQHLAQGWINFVFQHAVLIDVKSRVHASRDPDDDKYLACAIDGGAECIVSGDDDLLSLGSHVGIPILKPRQLIERVG
jgi:putative PIN family toxin of toxin-antitoxin system